MAKITIAENAGNYSFDVENFSIAMSDTWKSLGTTVLKYGDNKNNYIELHGSFTYSHGTSAYDVVKSVTSMKLVAGGDTVLQVSGLDIVKADVKNNSTLQDYFAGESYTIAGNSHNNTIVTADLNDRMNGNGGADTLTSNGGADVLSGGAGIDRLTGGLGRDVLIGGTQNDVFVFTAGDGADTINDFDAIGKAHDVIDLSGYVGIGAFEDLSISRARHDVRIELLNGDQILLKDVNVRDVDAGDFQF